MPITTTSPRIISLRFISNKFPRLLAEREIIANALFLPTMYWCNPHLCANYPMQKYKFFSNFPKHQGRTYNPQKLFFCFYS